MAKAIEKLSKHTNCETGMQHMITHLEKYTLSPRRAAELRKTFNEIDDNKDGILTKQELKKFLKS